MIADGASDACVDCQEQAAEITLRNRRLCSLCFRRYVHSKTLKRMESYRLRNVEGKRKRRLLLPLSCGVSSVALLQLLDAQLQRQIAKQNRTAFDLILVHVRFPGADDPHSTRSFYDRLAQRFSLHTFLPPCAIQEVFEKDETVERDLQTLGISRHEQESDADLFARVFSSASSVTTRTDLLSILLRRLLVAIAKQQGCESILWGHSDSRLAALTLAAVAKGRGGSVPSTIADGPSTHGVNFNYPMRDLFKAELQTYAQVSSEPLLEEAVVAETPDDPTPILRNTAIDTLVSSYIQSQGEKYPGIMANVVRTAGKLEATNGGQEHATCAVCAVCVMPLLRQERAQQANADSSLCYGCERMKNEMRV